MNALDLTLLALPPSPTPEADAPLEILLDRLPEGATAALRSLGIRQRYDTGDTLYLQGEHGDDLLWLVAGQVRLDRSEKGAATPRPPRILHPGRRFGEEALFGGSQRRETARATSDVEVLFIGRADARQLLRRAGLEPALETARARWRQETLLDSLRASPFLSALPPAPLSALLPKLTLRAVAQGSAVYEEGDTPEGVYLLGEGLVKVGRRVGSAEHIRAYLTPGDLFGALEVLSGTPRHANVTAMGPVSVLHIPTDAFTQLYRETPALKALLERQGLRGQERARDGNVELLKLAPRLDIAQSLLVIDLNRCVRCGNCAWSCGEVHGASRLTRRGETLTLGDAGATPLLVPSSCQHCTDAVCMTGCPTGAIGRELQGEVYIEGAACIGCGDCAKRCPWDNISMRELPAGGGPRAQAVKCDNCRGYKVSACSHSCPTGALRRVRPQDAFSELDQLYGAEASAPVPPRERRQRHLGRWLLGALLTAALGYALAHPAPLRGGSRMGMVFGIGALLTLGSAALFSARKRGIRWVMAAERGDLAPGQGLGKSERPITVSLATWLRLHLAAGVTALALALAHGGAGPWSPLAACLMGLFFGVTLTGLYGAWAYRVLPPLLSAIEETPYLVEDLGARQAELAQRVQGLLEERPPAFLRLAETLNRDLARPAWIGQILSRAWGLSATLREVKSLHRGALMQLRDPHRQAMDQVIEAVVEMRHLRVQRLLHRCLTAWLPPHILLALGLGLLLGAHLLQVALY